MRIKALIFFSILFFACGQKEKSQVEILMEGMKQRLNADQYTMVELDQNTAQGVNKVMKIEFTGCKKIDLMDKYWNDELTALAQGLKNNIEGSERFDLYEFTLQKDPNDTTPSKIGLNIDGKGFTVMKENLQ